MWTKWHDSNLSYTRNLSPGIFPHCVPFTFDHFLLFLFVFFPIQVLQACTSKYYLAPVWFSCWPMSVFRQCYTRIHLCIQLLGTTAHTGMCLPNTWDCQGMHVLTLVYFLKPVFVSMWTFLFSNLCPPSKRLSLDDPWGAVRQLCPDVGVCVISLVTMVLCSQMAKKRELLAAANITSVSCSKCVYLGIRPFP